MTLIILLFAIGIFLLAAEVLIPGGILGLAGAVLLFTGCVVSFVQLGTMEGLSAIGIALFAAGIVFFIQFKILPKTRFGKRFFLSREISASSTALGDEARDLIGKTAVSVTVLSPSGYVTIDGKRYEAVSQSGQVAKETELLVTDVNHFQIIVRTKS
ncbi:MAG: NfeD family protein [Luteolibacter sp.]